ncbi:MULTISPECIES: G5 domain-containing protein [unclassified Exiguobacterium]|uniref:G5 domain-containing protein n=1 Tax=unclassified Exiguobacterium TaxID=2644629 RepID=UPI001BE957EE|nr:MULTISPECIES: G5 domain-containing protein [unclassified Exiguobacterium]
MMLNTKRFAVHTLLLVLLVVLIYVPSFALISFTGKATEQTTFSETAKVGSVPVSGMSRKEAESAVQKAITEWSKKTPLTTGTGEETLPVPTELVTFDSEESVKKASLKTGGDLILSIDDEMLQSFLSTQPVSYSQEQTEAFKTWLTNTSKTLAEGNFDPSQTSESSAEGEVVSSITFSTRSAAEEQMITGMANVEIKPDQLMNVKTYGMDPIAASYVGSKLYELFAKTPFEIVERMPHATLPDDITLGYDVKIDEKTDFAVRNTQASVYRLVATQEGSDVTIELRGAPIKEAVTVVMEGEKTIPFRTITRYSATLSAGTTNDTQAGEEGKSIEVYRVMKTAKGEKKKLLSLDFYAAVPAVITKSSQEEQAPIVVPPTEETPSEDGTDSETPDESNPEDSQTDGTVETPDSPTSPDSPDSPTVPDEDNQGDPASPVDDESTGKAVG